MFCEDTLAACDTHTGWVLADTSDTSLRQAVADDDSLASRLILMGANKQTLRDTVLGLGLAGALGSGGYRHWRTGTPYMLGDGFLAEANRAEAAGLSGSRAMGARGFVWLEPTDLPELIARYLRA